MDDRAFLGKRRDRAIATILGFKERKVDDFVPEGVSAEFRSVILDQINDVVNLALVMLDPHSGINELYKERLEALSGEKGG